MTQWVQHISGQGEKWSVFHECESSWRARELNARYYFDLPKSEYVFCDPPERWVDVTHGCKAVRWQRPEREPVTVLYHFGILVSHENGYRLRKVRVYDPHECGKELVSVRSAFIIEKQETS